VGIETVSAAAAAALRDHFRGCHVSRVGDREHGMSRADAVRLVLRGGVLSGADLAAFEALPARRRYHFVGAALERMVRRGEARRCDLPERHEPMYRPA
jgi:hypothetical protein